MARFLTEGPYTLAADLACPETVAPARLAVDDARLATPEAALAPFEAYDLATTPAYLGYKLALNAAFFALVPAFFAAVVTPNTLLADLACPDTVDPALDAPLLIEDKVVAPCRLKNDAALLP